MQGVSILEIHWGAEPPACLPSSAVSGDSPALPAATSTYSPPPRPSPGKKTFYSSWRNSSETLECSLFFRLHSSSFSSECFWLAYIIIHLDRKVRVWGAMEWVRLSLELHCFSATWSLLATLVALRRQCKWTANNYLPKTPSTACGTEGVQLSLLQ